MSSKFIDSKCSWYTCCPVDRIRFGWKKGLAMAVCRAHHFSPLHYTRDTYTKTLPWQTLGARGPRRSPPGSGPASHPAPPKSPPWPPPPTSAARPTLLPPPPPPRPPRACASAPGSGPCFVLFCFGRMEGVCDVTMRRGIEDTKKRPSKQVVVNHPTAAARLRVVKDT